MAAGWCCCVFLFICFLCFFQSLVFRTSKMNLLRLWCFTESTHGSSCVRYQGKKQIAMCFQKVCMNFRQSAPIAFPDNCKTELWSNLWNWSFKFSFKFRFKGWMNPSIFMFCNCRKKSYSVSRTEEVDPLPVLLGGSSKNILCIAWFWNASLLYTFILHFAAFWLPLHSWNVKMGSV